MQKIGSLSDLNKISDLRMREVGEPSNLPETGDPKSGQIDSKNLRCLFFGCLFFCFFLSFLCLKRKKVFQFSCFFVYFIRFGFCSFWFSGKN